MRLNTAVFPVLLSTLLPLAACDAPDAADDADLTARSGESCPRWSCGYNTSEINGKSLQELHLGGQANADGVKIVGFLATQGLLVGYTLETDGDELIARGGLLGKTVLRGDQLIGSILLIQVQLGLVVPVVILDHDEVPSWAEDAAPVHAYALVYADLQQPLLQHSVCKGTLSNTLDAVVVVLAGERYNLTQKTVLPGQNGWITLGCAGSATAKMALMNYGPHSDFDGAGHPASVSQRQTTLKMITADYCGGGDSYTADGTPLMWENQSGTVTPAPQWSAAGVEAVWGPLGAICLDTPRLVDRDDVACALPSCAGYDLDDGEWRTEAVAE
ncbi:MAG: ADYC domain-containing protein [Nannocystaceae bacterium]